MKWLERIFIVVLVGFLVAWGLPLWVAILIGLAFEKGRPY